MRHVVNNKTFDFMPLDGCGPAPVSRLKKGLFLENASGGKMIFV